MARANPLNSFLDQFGVLIVDGGLATELEARGHDLSDDLWSARLLLDDPEAIRQVHYDYLKAGADCIISATYQATIEGFVRRGLAIDQARALLLEAIDIAVEVRDEFWSISDNREQRSKPIVAASIGPYGAALANGSEYSGEYGLDSAALYAFHRERWDLLSSAAADIVACETIPSFPEARALSRLIAETPDIFAWVCFSCRDEISISDGTPFASSIALFQDIKNVAAVGINCTAPRYIPMLIEEASSVTDKPIIIYPNSGEQYDGKRKHWVRESEPIDFALASQTWRHNGAQLIGGCCRTTPTHIKQIRKQLLG
jgi:homocysteine S-methyltransferase